MGEVTGISWTDSTINFWHGCTKVGPGCDHCYAEVQDKRFGPSHWGTGVERKKIKSAIPTLNKMHNSGDIFRAKTGRKQRVFVSSMSDFLDNEIDATWRAEAWENMVQCCDLEFQVLTKRIGNADKMIEGDWPGHIGLMATIVNQEEADRDIPKLLAVKQKRGIPWVGLSLEPLLGPIEYDFSGIDWAIIGGESGPHRRPMEIEWAENLFFQCRQSGTAIFFKQDNGLHSGERGRASDALWSLKEFPRAS